MSLSNHFASAHGLSVPPLAGFKEQCRQLRSALDSRGVETRLADIHQSLAASYGYPNYATYLDAANRAAAGNRVLAGDELASRLAEPGRLLLVALEGDFPVAGDDWALNVEDLDQMLVFNPNVEMPWATNTYRMGALISKHHGLLPIEEVHGSGLQCDALTDGEMARMIVTGVYSQCSRIDRGGVPHFGDHAMAGQRVVAEFKFSACQHTEVAVFDTDDDSGGLTVAEVFVPEDLFQALNLDFSRPVPGADGRLLEAEAA